jgi:hypothetical protein
MAILYASLLGTQYLDIKIHEVLWLFSDQSSLITWILTHHFRQYGERLNLLKKIALFTVLRKTLEQSLLTMDPMKRLIFTI